VKKYDGHWHYYFVDLSCMSMTMSSFVYNFLKDNPKIILSMGFKDKKCLFSNALTN